MIAHLVSVQKCKNTQSWGPAQTSYFYSAEMNLGIKLYERTEEARCLNQTECKHLSLTSSAVPHDSAWLCRQTKSAHQTLIQMSCFCRAKKYHTYVFWRGFLSCQVRGEFLRGFRKIPDLGMAVAQGFFRVAMEPMCNYVLQGRSTMSVMGLRNLVLDLPQR